MTPPHKERDLRCQNCGKRNGEHRASDYACPVGTPTEYGNTHYDPTLRFRRDGPPLRNK